MSIQGLVLEGTNVKIGYLAVKDFFSPGRDQ